MIVWVSALTRKPGVPSAPGLSKGSAL
jgi:hypothetical protein